MPKQSKAAEVEEEVKATKAPKEKKAKKAKKPKQPKKAKAPEPVPEPEPEPEPAKTGEKASKLDNAIVSVIGARISHEPATEVLTTAPVDARFATTQNQARYCWTIYNEMLRCGRVKGSVLNPACAELYSDAAAMCPSDWRKQWMQLRQKGAWFGVKLDVSDEEAALFDAEFEVEKARERETDGASEASEAPAESTDTEDEVKKAEESEDEHAAEASETDSSDAEHSEDEHAEATEDEAEEEAEAPKAKGKAKH